MAGRWRDPSAFRADPDAAPSVRPSRRQSLAMLVVLVLVAGVLAAVSLLIRPDQARTFDLFHGSIFLSDAVAPVAVDLASGRPTVRLAEANAQVGAKNAADLSVVPLTDGTLLLNRATGEFNMVDSTGFVVKTTGGVQLPQRAGSTGAVGIAAKDFAYVVQSDPTGTSVYVVGTTTVQSASNVNAKVKPRASRSMPEPSAAGPGAAASVGNDLWLLVGSGSRRTVRHLMLPPGSNPGALLRTADEGSVDGAAGIATAGSGSDQTAGVASQDRVMVFRGTSRIATTRWTPPRGVDKVLPATENTRRLSFLLHGGDGWSVVSTAADGSDLRGPTKLTGVAATADLVAPAASDGALYTMDAGSGQLIRIGGDNRARALGGVPNYPLAEKNGRSIEPAGFADGYVVARGPRVIYNSPSHLRAVVVFPDGSRGPLDIEKSSAVTVNAAGGAASLTRSRQNDQNKVPPPSRGRPAPKPVDPVNNKIDCKSTAQKPHIPLLSQPITGSRSVQLYWTYPTAGQQDCIPSTYGLNVTLLSTDAPAPPSQVTVQGQRSVNLTGLFPSKRYRISVTAYINGRGTESAPIEITTGPEGPAAPRNVAVRTDADGSWNVSWSACGSVEAGCVPSASWRVVPEFCDGRGLSGAPDQIDVTADPTAVEQPGATLRGGDALLGRGVRFTVEGIGADGATGKPSPATACTSSWSPSVAAGMQLSATTPAETPAGRSASTDLTLNLGADAAHNVGGIGAQIVLRLSGPDGTQASTRTFDGNKTNIVQARFDNVRPGATYTASASVSPPEHPGSGVGIGPVGVTTRSSWPALSVTDAQCPRNGNLLNCDLSFRIAGISSAAANGESFDLTGDSRLQCGNAGRPLVQTDFDPATATITAVDVSQLDNLFGPCTITIGLVEHKPRQPSYFGGIPSRSASSPVNLGARSQSGAGSQSSSRPGTAPARGSATPAAAISRSACSPPTGPRPSSAPTAPTAARPPVPRPRLWPSGRTVRIASATGADGRCRSATRT
ncbi:MAG: fibronectin type III domain-containing protein [Jatrophihabitans sp.]